MSLEDATRRVDNLSLEDVQVISDVSHTSEAPTPLANKIGRSYAAKTRDRVVTYRGHKLRVTFKDVLYQSKWMDDEEVQVVITAVDMDGQPEAKLSYWFYQVNHELMRHLSELRLQEMLPTLEVTCDAHFPIPMEDSIDVWTHLCGETFFMELYMQWEDWQYEREHPV